MTLEKEVNLNRFTEKIYGLERFRVYYIWSILAVIFAVFLILFIFLQAFDRGVLLQPAGTNLSSCGVLNASGYYILTINILSSGNCLQINASNVVLDGLSSFNITSSVVGSNTGILINKNNVTVKNIGVYNFANSIILNGVNNSVIENNRFFNSSVADVNISYGNSNSVRNNFFVNNTLDGVAIFNSLGNIVENNDFFGNGFVTGNVAKAIYLYDDSNNNILRNNEIYSNYYGFVTFSNKDNKFEDNIIDRANVAFFSFDYPLINPTEPNFLQRGTITNTNYIAIWLLQSNLVINRTSITNTLSQDIDVASTSTNSKAKFINTNFRAYDFNSDGTFEAVFVDEGNAEVRFLSSISGSGNNLSNDIKLRYNYVEVNSTNNQGLNKSANITFYSLPTNWINSEIRRNGEVCPSNICFSFTPLNAGTVAFNVTGWTFYTIYGISIPTITINEPDPDEVYRTNEFPVTFDVSLDTLGRVYFVVKKILNSTSLIVLNATMNSTNNISFSYNVNSLDVGNYTLTTYANFSFTSIIISNNVSFRVLPPANGSQPGPGPGPGPPGNNTGNQTDNQNNNQTSQNGSSSNLPGSSSNVEVEDIIYWLIVAILVILILIVVSFIVRHLQKMSLDRRLEHSGLFNQSYYQYPQQRVR